MQPQHAPSRSALTALMILLSSNAGVSAGKTMIGWLSPSEGDVFGPDDTVFGNWSADGPIISPSFRLCTSGPSSSLNAGSVNDGDASDDSCGDILWPDVQETDGVYSVAIAAPTVNKATEYYLRMDDDFETVRLSPKFSLSPTEVSGPTAESEPDPPSPNKNTAKSEPDPPTTEPKEQSPPAVDSPQSPMSVPPIVPAGVSQAPLAVASTPADPQKSQTPLLAARTSAFPVVFAVSFAVVGVVLLVSAGLAIRYKRKLRKACQQRQVDAEKAASLFRRDSSWSTKSGYDYRSRDVEDALSRAEYVDYHGGASMPVPLFMPADIRREAVPVPRLSTRQVFPGYGVSPPDSPARTERMASDRRVSRSRPQSTRSTAGRKLGRECHDDDVVSSVIDDYMEKPSELPECALTVPQRLHVRNEAYYMDLGYEDGGETHRGPVHGQGADRELDGGRSDMEEVDL